MLNLAGHNNGEGEGLSDEAPSPKFRFKYPLGSLLTCLTVGHRSCPFDFEFQDEAAYLHNNVTNSLKAKMHTLHIGTVSFRLDLCIICCVLKFSLNISLWTAPQAVLFDMSSHPFIPSFISGGPPQPHSAARHTPWRRPRQS